MTDPLHMQLQLSASPDAIFRALTESSQLAAWFAEYADVSLEERRYAFWGRFTPECPDRARGQHPLLAVEPHELLHWTWNLTGAEGDVALRLLPRADATLLIVRHNVGATSHDIALPNFEDFWFLSLENLRRHLDGRDDIVRCDFSAIKPGDITHSVEIDGSPAEVFGTLIRPEQLNRWIASDATVEPVTGGNYQFGWQGVGPHKILELVPDQRLAISWPEEIVTVVTWTLEESGGKTRLTLVHSGFAPDQATSGLNAGWLNFMSWIKSLVEYGPAWRPSVLAVQPSMRSYYPRSIGDAQDQIVVFN